MQAEEGGADREENRANGRDKGGPGDKIGIGGGDDAVVRIQLAARWSEAHAPKDGDTLVGVLKRFRAAYEYLDAVIHGVEPVEPDMDEIEPRPVAAAAPAAPTPPPPAPPAPPQSYAPPTSYSPPPQPPSQPESEPRPWG